MPSITLDWKFSTTLLAAIAGVLVPILLWQFDLSSRSLSVRLISSVALQPDAGPSVQGLQLVLDGVKLESPYLSTIELVNDGSRPIAATDFESPLEVHLNQERHVVRARISSSQPTGIPGLLITDKDAIRLQPLLLNPKDALTFAVVTSGGQPIFEPRARISGVSRIMYEDTTAVKPGWKTAIILLPIAVLSLVLYMFYAVSLFRPHTASVSRLLAAGTMVVCVFAANLLARRAYQAIGIEATPTSISAFLFVALLVGTPIFFRQARISRRRTGVV